MIKFRDLLGLVLSGLIMVEACDTSTVTFSRDPTNVTSVVITSDVALTVNVVEVLLLLLLLLLLRLLLFTTVCTVALVLILTFNR
jgi:hypothetical protein